MQVVHEKFTFSWMGRGGHIVLVNLKYNLSMGMFHFRADCIRSDNQSIINYMVFHKMYELLMIPVSFINNK